MQPIFDTVALVLILTKAGRRFDGGLMALITKQGLAYYMCVYRRLFTFNDKLTLIFSLQD